MTVSLSLSLRRRLLYKAHSTHQHFHFFEPRTLSHFHYQQREQVAKMFMSLDDLGIGMPEEGLGDEIVAAHLQRREDAKKVQKPLAHDGSKLKGSHVRPISQPWPEYLDDLRQFDLWGLNASREDADTMPRPSGGVHHVLKFPFNAGPNGFNHIGQRYAIDLRQLTNKVDENGAPCYYFGTVFARLVEIENSTASLLPHTDETYSTVCTPADIPLGGDNLKIDKIYRVGLPPVTAAEKAAVAERHERCRAIGLKP